MGYLQDYVYYSSGHEVPEDYIWWGGLSILGHVLGNKVWIRHGDYFRFPPNLFVCLVGDAGSGKNTALGVNIDIMINHFPRKLVSASIQSREDVSDLMASDACVHTWKDHDGRYGKPGEIRSWRPFYILNNELASFLSVDKMKMVEFLTEVYDGKRFSTGFKGQRIVDPSRKQFFENPHVSLLAGAVPTWFMGNLKLDLFAGGLGRRLIIVHAQRTKVVHDPTKPPGADEAMARVVDHLKQANEFQGELIRTPIAMKWWKEWYTQHRNKRIDDPILQQFHQTEHMQLLKIACCLRCAEPKLGHDVTDEHLQVALALLEKLKDPIVRLTSGIGRNEFAAIASQMLAHLEAAGGALRLKKFRITFYRHLRDQEFNEITQHLMDTDQIRVWKAPDGIHYIAFPERYEEILKKGKVE